MRVVLCLAAVICLTGCYSFTGGSVPDHIKTLQITPVNDNSGYGLPLVREELTQNLFQRFRNDNTLKLVESAGDARLTVTIVRISDETIAVNPGEIETKRRVKLECSAEYFDTVKKKEVFKRNFTGLKDYEVANAFQNRSDALVVLADQVAQDIMLAVVSGW